MPTKGFNLNRRFAFASAMLPLLWSSTGLWAEDWTTTDGKVYRDVKTVSFEPDTVTILYRDGGAVVPLANLSPELQQRFHYDPAMAKRAAEWRAQDEAANAKALQAEKELTQEQQKKLKEHYLEQQQAAEASSEAKRNYYAAHSYQLFNDSGSGDLLEPPKDGPPHYKMEDLERPDSGGKAAAPAAGEASAPVAPSATPAPGTDLSSLLEVSKIRLVGKVRTVVPGGGYILKNLLGCDGYVIKADQSRPDCQLVSQLSPQGAVYLDTPDGTHLENDILDLDVYPVGTYTSAAGESMRAFTTRADYARAYLQHASLGIVSPQPQ